MSSESKSYSKKKEHEGKKYAGMRVGGVHRWDYPDGRWHERKLEPSRWEINFTSHKKRRAKAPKGSGAGVGSGYHWLIIADQWVRKVDANTYATVMEGQKRLVAFQKPEWERWNTEFRNQPTARQKTIRFLREALEALEAEEAEEAPRVDEPWQHPTFGQLGLVKDAPPALRALVPEEVLSGRS